MYSRQQSSYFAHWLSLRGSDEESLTQTIASAKVDMNPHQIQAALFALRSPMSRGVILADEVGLGKTIEASLVLAQRWAEQKRQLLLIVPATLRKQWAQELLDKFELPALILESKNFNQAKKTGVANPFDVQNWQERHAIMIVSYEFASAKQAEVAQINWDLVVFDEAHKLRNIYKKEGSKIANNLNNALRNCPKILMTATPLQNSLLELYGLVSVIDPYFFGDLASFKARYIRPNIEVVELNLLRQRLKPVVNRSLRKQVQETGSFNFTRRYSLTENFHPSPQEVALYHAVSNYLSSDDLLAIGGGARQLVSLVIHKILASSSYAIQGTLEKMIKRLQDKACILDELEQDFETLSDSKVEQEANNNAPPIDEKALQAEIADLSAFKKMAETIVKDAKAEALQRVLSRAFDMAERLGGARKAVIFTESVRTQQWLFELLGNNGFQDKIVLLNGSNQDAASRKIYQAWLQKHQGSVRVSGSKSADMKAALVDAFREQATLMISTEAGAEGINLQFCSLLINYDLPWNPQRVEQRIGRIHRYGQKHDVVVVNFINKENYADERVFELLNEKFQLFEGVFGASDEVLGSIESGVDIERRIHDIYQQCRDHEEIKQAFDALREKLKPQLDKTNKETSRSILENFDTDVVKRLNIQNETTAQKLNEYQHMMLRLARAELSPDALFDKDYFIYEDQGYDLNWPQAEADDRQFFRPYDGLGKQVIAQAKAYDLSDSVRLEFDYAKLESQRSDVRSYVGKTGELIVEKYIIETKKQKKEYLLVSACTDEGDMLEAETTHRLLLVPAIAEPATIKLKQQNCLQENLKNLQTQYFAQAEQDNEHYYDEETDKLDNWQEDRQVALDIKIKQLDKEIKDMRRAARQLPSLQEKITAKREVKKLQSERDKLMLNYYEEKKKIEGEAEDLLDEAAVLLEMSARSEPLFSAYWKLEDKHD
ncbi:SNF2-related protein [Candidatus Venteria ishoeyi]|uniref:RNA polymerase-associated protein RapA n=1 Tax=Candidatus Venteria ishoeyi TaxID=1899563 RepID=A0A1H6F4Z8_9GAMM|nr:SNF2-related protein [Candidatus Venteria ishoeyi]SEH04166.1 RNA polymerase-associated protein RapA [Candidatus Venteria ishoeyi]